MFCEMSLGTKNRRDTTPETDIDLQFPLKHAIKCCVDGFEFRMILYGWGRVVYLGEIDFKMKFQREIEMANDVQSDTIYWNKIIGNVWLTELMLVKFIYLNVSFYWDIKEKY